MAAIHTTRFGKVEVAEQSILNMAEGMLGFEDCRRYVLLEDKPDTPLKWLQSVDNPELAFIVVNPYDFVPNYDFELPDEDAVSLGIASPDDAVVLTTVTVDKQGSEVTANLLGPIVINSLSLAAKQVVLQDERYGTKHSIGKYTDAEAEAEEALATAKAA